MKKQKQQIDLPALWQHLSFVALEALRDNDGRMPLADLLDEIDKREGTRIPESARASYASGAVRWKSNVQFECDTFVKAGFLRKGGGVWLLTAQGAEAIALGEATVIKKAKAAYREWQEKRKSPEKSLELQEDGAATAEHSPKASIGDYQSEAATGIQDYIRALPPYKFQDLCAAWLRGMGYYVRDVAAPGRDGGIDVLAYADPLGGRPPRIKVQVKHESSKTGEPALRELAGLLTDGDVGIFVSSFGFAAGCRDFARNNSKHLELIDLPRFIELWQEHYDKLSEEDKSLLPLQAIYFLDEKRARGDS